MNNTIKKLKVRFVLLSMLSVFLVIGVLLTIINVVNYNRVADNSDHILKFLAINDGTFGIDKFDPKNDPKKELGPETPYETRYFTVKYTDETNGTIITDIHSIAAIKDVKKAIEMADNILNKKKEKGYSGIYRYLISKKDDSTLVIFVDCSRQLDTANMFLKSSIAVALVGMALIFAFLCVFSKKAIAPIAKSYERQKRFITDAGHELKTPLTIISANNELIELESGENEYTVAISKQINRMNTLVKNLSLLAKLDESEVLSSVKEFSLTDAVFDVYNNFKTVLDSKYTVTIDICENVGYVGDENLIRQLLTIIFDNANKYAVSKIDIKLEKNNSKISLTVSNDAQDIENGDLSRVFERFYRSNEARGSSVEGSGIGLSVAKEITDLHHGVIEATGMNGIFKIKLTL